MGNQAGIVVKYQAQIQLNEGRQEPRVGLVETFSGQDMVVSNFRFLIQYSCRMSLVNISNFFTLAL